MLFICVSLGVLGGEYCLDSGAIKLMIFQLWLRPEWGCAFYQSLEDWKKRMQAKSRWKSHILFFFFSFTVSLLRLQVMGSAC